MQAHKVKTQRLLPLILLTAFPLSLFALTVNSFEAVSRWGRNLEADTVLAQADELTSDLSLTKSVDDPTPLVGDTIVFTIEVGNSGPDDTTGVGVSDTLPSGYNYAGDNSSGTYSDTIGLWTIGEIAQGVSKTVNISAEVLATGIYSNYAQVATSLQLDPDSIPGNDSKREDDDDTVATSPRPISDLSITKDVDDATPFVGTQVVFTLRVDNGGPSNATGVFVEDQLPDGYTYVDDDGVGTYDPFSGEWDVGNITASSFAEHQITATVKASGDYTNIAQVTAANEFDPDSTPNNNVPSEDDQDSATTTPEAIADLSLTKNVDNPTPLVGEQVVFTVRVDNGGPSDATGVVVSDQLPSGYTYVSDDGEGDYVSGTGVWTVGDITADAFRELQLTATVKGDGDYTNVAQIIGLTETDPDLSNNKDSATIDLYVIHLPIVKKGRDFGEPNDQCQTAAYIAVNVDNRFRPEDQDDWYQFDLPSTGDLFVELSNFLPMEGQLTVYRGDSCATRQLLGINGNPAINKVLDLATQPVGHYYIYVSNDADPSLGPYTLRVNFKP
jgi:uncharacterized repeat protein (TIGR01451 family)